MPGCTAPNCTNSSQKGYKLYHFPSDKERNSVWVQNCGRERGWKPTKHTCVCEVHFEESQFESHRADGLRKLKPNAIPTIFNRVTPIRSYTRKPKKESSKDNVSPGTKENEGMCKAVADSELKVTSHHKESELKGVAKEQSDEPVWQEGEVAKEPDHTYPKFTLEEDKEHNNKDVTLDVEEAFLKISVPSQYSPSPVRGRKRGRPVRRYGKKEDIGESSQEESGIHRGRKRGRPPGSTNKSKASLASPVRKSVRVSARKREHLPDISNGMVQEGYPPSENKAGEFSVTEISQCFVCGKSVDNGISMHTLTNTTKVYMHDKLDKIVRGEMELLIEEEGTLCNRCTNLLNYVDRIEVELNMLTKAILNCIRKKYGMGVRVCDKGCENLLPNMTEYEKEFSGEGEVMNLDLQLRSTDGTSSQWRENEDNDVVSSGDVRNDTSSSTATDEKHESSPSEEMQCRVCKFKTCYKSLMIFHLRQHLKDTFWCDFCNVCLPEGTVGQMGKAGEESHNVTGTDIDDDGHAIADMQDEEAQQEAEINDAEVKVVTESDTGMLANSMDLMIAVLPVSAEVAPQDTVIESDRNETGVSTEDTLQLSNENSENSSSLHHAQSISNSVKCVRILNEMGMIITQEIGSVGEGKDNGTVVCEEFLDSQFPSQTTDCSTVDLTVESQALGDESKGQHILSRCLGGENSKGSVLNELGLNMEQVRNRQFRVLNEMGVIEVVSVESTEQLMLDSLNCDVNEMRVNVTPGMMTYSNNDRRLNAS